VSRVPGQAQNAVSDCGQQAAKQASEDTAAKGGKGGLANVPKTSAAQATFQPPGVTRSIVL